jgi:hypothetical protein
MTIIRAALVVLIGASVAQLAPAGTELASRLETAFVEGDNAPVDNQVCEVQHYIEFRHSSTSAWFDSSPRPLEPFPCLDPLAASAWEFW